jgi:CPA1 family monovalent cation:H+ antiporter
LYISKGIPFPQRNLILFITFTVILLTLVVQGLTLPLVIKWFNLEDPDHYAPLEEQDMLMKKELAAQSVAFLDKHYNDVMKDNDALLQLRVKLEREQSIADPEVGVMQADFSKAYLHLLEQQRLWLIEMNKRAEMDGDIIRRHQQLLDLEEEKIRVRYRGTL